MSITNNLSWTQVDELAKGVAKILLNWKNPLQTAYPIPRGGIYAAQAVRCHMMPYLAITSDPGLASIYIDDILDSGQTRERVMSRYGTKPWLTLINKLDTGSTDWYSFPWERDTKEDGPHDNIRRIIQFIGDDPKRSGLLETPDRVVRSYAELFSGYTAKEEDVFKTFDDTCDEMVVFKNIEFYSTCEHHMLPFAGRATIGYIPNGKVIGASKIARLLEVFARRLQIQERLTTQVTTALDKHLEPLGSACVLEATHLCMTCRGVAKQHSSMVTSSLTGAFRKDPSARAEFYSFYNGK